MREYERKTSKTGSLALSQKNARALATGIGQSKEAAFIEGTMRAVKVADCIPPEARKALKGVHSGYPEPMLEPKGLYAAEYGNEAPAVMQTRVNGRVP